MTEVTPMTESLRFDQILFNVRAANRRQALDAVSAQAAQACGLDAAPLAARLWERDMQATSGVGDGLAIPHMKLKNLRAPFLLIARLHQAVDFAALDDVPVDLIVLLLSPEKDGNIHLQRLSRLSRLLRDDAFRALLRGAESEDALTAFLYEREGFQIAA